MSSFGNYFYREEQKTDASHGGVCGGLYTAHLKTKFTRCLAVQDRV